MSFSLHNIKNGWLDPESADPVLLFRQRAVLTIATLCGAAVLPLIAYDLSLGNQFVAAIEAIAVLLVLAVYALLYLTRRPGPGADLTLSVLWLASTMLSISTSGVTSTAMLYYLLLPLIGGLLLGLRGVLLWGLMGLLGISALSVGHIFGWLPGHPFGENQVFQIILDITVLLVISTGATAAFLLLQQQTQARFLATMSHELRTPSTGSSEPQR